MGTNRLLSIYLMLLLNKHSILFFAIQICDIFLLLILFKVGI